MSYYESLRVGVTHQIRGMGLNCPIEERRPHQFSSFRSWKNKTLDRVDHLGQDTGAPAPPPDWYTSLLETETYARLCHWNGRC